MRRFSAVAALLLLSVAPSNAADANPVEDSAPAPWYKRIFSSSKPKAEPKPEPVAVKPPTWQDVSRSLDQERAVYMERLEFCTQLKIIAVKTNDDALSKKAEELEALAEQVYMKRTNKLPAIVQDVKAAEATLDQKPGSPASGSWANSGKSTTNGRSANGRPITRE